jgi:hypothetical protein
MWSVLGSVILTDAANGINPYSGWPRLSVDGTNVFASINTVGGNGYGGFRLLRINQSSMSITAYKHFTGPGPTFDNGDYYYLTTYNADPTNDTIYITCIWANPTSFFNQNGIRRLTISTFTEPGTPFVYSPGDDGDDISGDWYDSRILGGKVYGLRFDGGKNSWLSTLTESSFSFTSATTSGGGTRNSEAVGLLAAGQWMTNDGSHFYVTANPTFAVPALDALFKVANSNLNSIVTSNAAIGYTYWIENGGDGNLYLMTGTDNVLRQVSKSTLTTSNSFSPGGTVLSAIDAGDRLYYGLTSVTGTEIYELIYSTFTSNLVIKLDTGGGIYQSANAMSWDSTSGFLFVGQNAVAASVTITRTTDNSLAFDGSGICYTIDRTTTPGTTYLLTVDVSTGATTELGNIGIANISALAFDGATLYAVSGAGNNPSTLYELNPANGAVISTIGATGYSHVTALAIRPSDSVLFGYVSGSATEGLVTISKITGAATPVGSGFSKQVPDISFHPTNNTLYGAVASPDFELNTINTTSGVLTGVMSLPTNTPYGLAWKAGMTPTLYLKNGYNPETISFILPVNINTKPRIVKIGPGYGYALNFHQFINTGPTTNTIPHDLPLNQFTATKGIGMRRKYILGAALLLPPLPPGLSLPCVRTRNMPTVSFDVPTGGGDLNTTWTVPEGVCQILVECQADGGNGFDGGIAGDSFPCPGGTGGDGGGGGGYAASIINVIPGQVYPVNIYIGVVTEFGTGPILQASSGQIGGTATGDFVFYGYPGWYGNLGNPGGCFDAGFGDGGSGGQGGNSYNGVGGGGGTGAASNSGAGGSGDPGSNYGGGGGGGGGGSVGPGGTPGAGGGAFVSISWGNLFGLKIPCS